MIDFKDKVVIVTGASSGIGEDVSKGFAKLGASLTLTGRNMNRLNAVADQCKTNGAKDVLVVQAEFENLPEIKNIVDQTLEKFGKIDCLVNSAGVLKSGSLCDLNMDEFDWIFQINVKSTVYLTHLVMPHLVKTKGTIVNLSSTSGIHQLPGQLIYCLSKAALDQFTKTIALEYASKGVRVNSINPSHVRTNINRHTGLNEVQVDQMYEKAKTLFPSGRIGTVADTTRAILFLSSDASSWITGQCLVMDGGRYLNVPQLS